MGKAQRYYCFPCFQKKIQLPSRLPPAHNSARSSYFPCSLLLSTTFSTALYHFLFWGGCQYYPTMLIQIRLTGTVHHESEIVNLCRDLLLSAVVLGETDQSCLSLPHFGSSQAVDCGGARILLACPAYRTTVCRSSRAPYTVTYIRFPPLMHLRSLVRYPK